MAVSCPTVFQDPFRCPRKEDYLQAYMALLPRGRAWQSHEQELSSQLTHYPETNAECGEAQCGAAQAGQVGVWVDRTVLARYFAAHSEVLEYFADHACKLLEEFFCPTANETLDWWGSDYGFPDECQPWSDLCDKVSVPPSTGTTCEELSGLASIRGWTITCSDCAALRGPCAGLARAGECSRVCVCPEPNAMRIIIDLPNSPAYSGGYAQRKAPRANSARANCALICDAGALPGQLACIIDQLKPAHVRAYYDVIE